MSRPSIRAYVSGMFDSFNTGAIGAKDKLYGWYNAYHKKITYAIPEVNISTWKAVGGT